MSKISLQIITEQIHNRMYSYDDMVKIVDAIIEAFELGYPEYGSLAGEFTRKLREAIRQWKKEDK